MDEGPRLRLTTMPLFTWAVSVLLGVLAGVFTAGARVQAVQDRVAVVERDQVRASVGDEEFRRLVLEQLRRLEVTVAELRAEQRILHMR